MYFAYLTDDEVFERLHNESDERLAEVAKLAVSEKLRSLANEVLTARS